MSTRLRQVNDMRTSQMIGGLAVSLGLMSGTALAQGNWNITNGDVGDFATWAATSGVQPLVGDFNGDAHTTTSP
jgi:hypothetical protein